jgi:hypothetical protein
VSNKSIYRRPTMDPYLIQSIREVISRKPELSTQVDILNWNGKPMILDVENAQLFYFRDNQIISAEESLSINKVLEESRFVLIDETFLNSSLDRG